MQINPIPVIFGALFFAAGLFLVKKQLTAKKKNTESVNAMVLFYYTETKHSAKGGHSTVHYPVLGYEVNGQWYEKRSDTGRGSMPYEEGSQIVIKYDPEDPNNFIIEGDKSSFIMGGIFMLLGLIVFYFGLTGK